MNCLIYDVFIKEGKMEDYIKLHEQYMKLQSIPWFKISIKERNELQLILEKLINNKQSTKYDIDTYYWPRYNSYENEIKDIKFNIEKQIAEQVAKIIFAQRRIDELRRMLI
jgi:hypothetical protein